MEDFLEEVGLEKTLTISTEGQGGCSRQREGSEKSLEVGGQACCVAKGAGGNLVLMYVSGMMR